MGDVEGVLQMAQSSEWLTLLVALWIKSIVILATAALLSRILRAAWARLRHALWCMALSSLLVLPVFSGGLHLLEVPVLPASLVSDDFAESERTLGNAPEMPAAFTPAPVSQPELVADTPSVGSSVSWPSIVLLVWLIGVLLILTRVMIGVFIVRGLVARASELTGTWSELTSELSQRILLKRPVRLLRSDKGVMPMTCGGLSATVLLPVDADDWCADRRRIVLLHELIHVKRRDILTQTMAQVVCSLYWFNPLVWWALRRMRTEQEWACDEGVVATGVAAPEYAGHLLEIARRFDANGISTATTTAMAGPSQLQDRLCAILRPVGRGYWYGRAIPVSVAMGVVLISSAVIQLVPAPTEAAIVLSESANDLVQLEVGDQIKPPTVIPGRTHIAPIRDDRTLQQTPSTTPTPPDQPANDRVPPAPSQLPVDNRAKEQDFSDFSVEEKPGSRVRGSALHM